jgi:large subunit ribosomal protein L29
MTIEEIRGLDTKEIEGQLKEMGEQMFRFKFQMSMGQAEGLKKYRILRTDRARMLGVVRERELTGNPGPVKSAAAVKGAKKKGK